MHDPKSQRTFTFKGDKEYFYSLFPSGNRNQKNVELGIKYSTVMLTNIHLENLYVYRAWWTNS